MKTCRKCLGVKINKEFPKFKLNNGKYQHISTCKVCVELKREEYRQNNLKKHILTPKEHIQKGLEHQDMVDKNLQADVIKRSHYLKLAIDERAAKINRLLGRN